jgi:cellulose synthase/poly-beta-1,6-N-acetylglucosamine synthase-like glycosyltransferase
VIGMFPLGLALTVFCGAILLFGWVVYPRLVLALARSANEARRKVLSDSAASAAPEPATVVIATREPPDRLIARVSNILANGYPRELLHVVVAVDALAEHTIEEYSAALGANVRVVLGDRPGGKASALNAGVRAATTPLVVFADSVPLYRHGAIRELIAQIASSPQLGAVTGTLDLSTGSQGDDPVLGRFWDAELALRRAHAAMHSVCVVTGCVYVLRRVLWRPLPAGAICDDLFVPMAVIAAGYRVGVSDVALAVDTRSFSRSQEFQRKVRTLTGMLQFVRHRPAVLLPWRNPVWAQFVFHKLLRIATPFLLAFGAIGVALTFLAQPLPGFVWLSLAACVALVLVAALLSPHRARRVVTNAAWAVLLLCAPIVAVWNALRGDWDVWRPHSSSISRG